MRIEIKGIDETISKLNKIITELPGTAYEGLIESAEEVKLSVIEEAMDWNLKWIEPPSIELGTNYVFVRTPIWCEKWAMEGITERKQMAWIRNNPSITIRRTIRPRRNAILPFVTVRSIGNVLGIVFAKIDRLIRGK